LISPLSVSAQLLDTELYNFENGLSNSRVQALAVEPNGLLWIGTSDGLNVYNGVKFQSFRNQPLDYKSLCDNRIQSICVASDKNIWIGTRNGLSLFERKTGTFFNYYHENPNPFSISSNNILGVFEDNKHNLWVQTSVSLDFYDKASNRFLHYYPYNDFFNFTSRQISSITEDHNGDIWIATKDGVNRLDRHLSLFERFSPQNGNDALGSSVVLSIYCSKKGKLWVGTDKALCVFDKKKHSFYRVWPNNAAQKTGSVLAITEDKAGFVWVATTEGVFCISSDNKIVKSFDSLSWRNTQQSFSSLNVIVCDNSNVLWLGSNLGLAKWDLKRKKFNKLVDKSLTDVAAFYSDNQYLWLGSRDNGIIKFNIKTKTVEKSIKELTINSKVEKVAISQLFESKSHNFFVGTENGLFVKLFNSEVFTDACKISRQTVCKSNLHHRIHKIREASDGRVLVATEQGLHVYSSDLSKLEHISKYKIGLKSETIGEIHSFISENNDELWLGTKGDLVKINIKTKEGQRYQIASKVNDIKTEVDIIFDIYDDRKGKLWLATSGGLAVFTKKTGKISYIENASGIVYSYIYAILNDNEGNLWLSSNKGIIKYSINSNTFYSFNISDGLQGFEFNSGAAIKLEDGQMFFGGLSGVNYFSPDSIEYNNFVPQMIISSFDIIKEGKRQPVYITGETDQKIILPRNISSFSIDFSSLDYSNPSKNNYAYRLIHNEKETSWIDHQNRTSVSFTNLSAGLYKFEVKGTNNDGVWSTVPASIYIEIKSPWWLSGYAAVFYILLVTAIVLLVIQIRTYNLRKTNRMLREKEIAARKIERQREELAIQNKNIRDSINYAKRLQEALMPSEKIVKKHLPNSFVFHRPKDIVSGDFFWVSNHGSRLILAAVDCTGHGVPGAFMSIIGYELFRKITSNHPMKRANELLQLLTDEFVGIFSDVEEFSMHDGMDVSLCCIDLKTNIIEYAGAFNPLYYVRNNKIEEVKGNRFSVSLRSNKEIETVGFQNNQIQAMPGDVFYIFSDGYADQFGGSEGKKFKYRRFRHLLLSIHRLSFAEQRSYLSESIDLWKGNLEQVDDVLVIGFKLI
jgi:ligand-binding sensor domain-containing protein/serine phosphatase RsbU (regulator of sigma subunit)